MSILKKILRAAVAQPWDYMGDGAPDDWEFRVSPDEETVAMFSPGRGDWVFFSQVIVLAREQSLNKADKATHDWRQFLSVEEPDD